MLEAYVGGIPNTAFRLNESGKIPGKSGHEVSYENTYYRIDIVQGKFNCSAFLEDGFLRLILRTRDKKNEHDRPPDLFAKLFAQAAQQQFRENGKRINGFKAVWVKGSDNYDQFTRNLQSGMHKNDAARMTWSGELAQTLGYFSKVTVQYKPGEEYVTAIFT